MGMGKSHEGGVCLSCGGRVNADGMAEGGEVESGSGEHEMGDPNPVEVGDTSPQFELNKRMHRAALASALKGK